VRTTFDRVPHAPVDDAVLLELALGGI